MNENKKQHFLGDRLNAVLTLMAGFSDALESNSKDRAQANINALASLVLDDVPKDRLTPALQARTPEATPNTSKRTVYVVTERDGKTFWTNVGVAHNNRDGSTTVKLDALPLSGTLQVNP